MNNKTFGSGDIVVVTGAAQGIGRAIATRLASIRAQLSLWDVRKDGLEETAELCRRAGALAHTSLADVGEWPQVEAAAHERRLNFKGAPFALVSNAGIFPRSKILETAPQTWERVLKVNLIGAFHCVRALGPMMVEAKRGAIVTVASGRALQGTPRGAHYAASKAGLVSFTKSLALELAPAGIRANCIIPGVTETAQPLENTSLEGAPQSRQEYPLGANWTAGGHSRRGRVPSGCRRRLHDWPGYCGQRRSTDDPMSNGVDDGRRGVSRSHVNR